MKEGVKNFLVKDLVNKDFGWKFGKKRTITFEYHNCDIKPKLEYATLHPQDTITFNPCPKSDKPLSWQGTLVWDGRKLSEKK